jgi:hypothetical protein
LSQEAYISIQDERLDPAQIARELGAAFDMEDGPEERPGNPRERAMIDDAVELVTLLAARGVEMPKTDVATVMKAEREFGTATWSPDSAAEVAQSFARLSRAAAPASLGSLRYAASGRSRYYRLAVRFALLSVGALIIAVLAQLFEVRIASVIRNVEVLQNQEPSPPEKLIATELKRLGRPTLLLLGVDIDAQGPKLSPAAVAHNAKSVLLLLDTFVLPALFGMLGAMAFILRNYGARLEAATVTGDSAGEYVVRVVLGLVAGVAIGLYLQPSADTQQLSPAVPVIGVATPMALAFLAGYATELLFGIMDRIVTAFSSEKKVEKPSGRPD